MCLYRLETQSNNGISPFKAMLLKPLLLQTIKPVLTITQLLFTYEQIFKKSLSIVKYDNPETEFLNCSNFRNGQDKCQSKK